VVTAAVLDNGKARRRLCLLLIIVQLVAVEDNYCDKDDLAGCIYNIYFEREEVASYKKKERFFDLTKKEKGLCDPGDSYIFENGFQR
jgi:hypothetical protein